MKQSTTATATEAATATLTDGRPYTPYKKPREVTINNKMRGGGMFQPNQRVTAFGHNGGVIAVGTNGSATAFLSKQFLSEDD